MVAARFAGRKSFRGLPALLNPTPVTGPKIGRTRCYPTVSPATAWFPASKPASFAPSTSMGSRTTADYFALPSVTVMRPSV